MTRPALPARLRGLLVVGVTGAGLVAGAALGYQSGLGVVATAVVSIPPAPGNAYANRVADRYQGLETEAALTTSDAVLDDAAGRATTLSRPDLERCLRATVLPGAEVVAVSCSASTRSRAEEGASAVATALVDRRRERLDAALSERAAGLTQEVTETRGPFVTAVEDGAGGTVTVLGRRLALLRGAAAVATLSTAADDRAGDVLRTDARVSSSLSSTAAGGAAGAVPGLLLAGLSALRWHRGRYRAAARP